jgi:dihydrofolate synthase/folylpolyglutamate synthase
MDYRDARSFLYQLRHGGSRYGRPRMWRVLEALGHPQWQVPAIHVAGTNGKGSVCALLEVALRRAGFHTGLFTSPHLIQQGERIQNNRVPMSDEQILAYTIELKELADRIFPEGDPVGYLSFFEFMTVMAFLHFQRSGIEIAIIETGLGGRLDSTNVLKPLACAITSIDLDHMEVLGDSLEQIALEKAGILHTGVPAVIGPMVETTRAVFERVSLAQKVPLTWVQDLYGEGGRSLPTVALQGEHQRWNGAVAEAVLQALPAPFSRAVAGAREAFHHVEWAGRWQQLDNGNVRVCLDAAHNGGGVRQLLKLLAQQKENGVQSWTVVVGATGIERAKAFVPILCQYAHVVYLAKPDHPRATTIEEWKDLLTQAGYVGEIHEVRVRELFSRPAYCAVGDSDHPVLVTGSLYLIGEVLDRWKNDPPICQSGLQDV